jgi:hypothetical protein
MKNRILIAVTIMFSLSLNAQQERKSLIKLDTGESLVMNESSVFGIVSDSYCLITVKYVNSKPNFYKWTNQGKTGPFTIDQITLCENISDPCSDNTEYVVPQEENNINSYQDEDGTYVELNGKKYGPYEMIMSLKINPAGSKIFLTASTGGKNVFICTDGRSVELKGMPDLIMVSPNGNDAYVRTFGAYSMSDLQNLAQGIDFTKMNEINFTGISGKKVGPFQSESISSWYSKYSDTWFLKVDEDIYTDGILWKAFSALYSNSFWFVDKQHYANLNSEGQLIFSDGKTFDYPVCITSEKIGNIIILRWVAIESNEVVLYKKGL